MRVIAKDKTKPRLESPSRQSFIRSLQTSAFIKLALFSVNVCFLPKWLSLLIFLLSQIQVFSIFAYTAILSFPEKINWLRNALVASHKFSSVGDLWSIHEDPNIHLAALTIILLLVLVEISCMVYLVINVFVTELSMSWVEKLWCILTNIHLHLFFYPIHFLGTKTLSLIWEEKADALISLVPSIGIQAVIFVCLIWNFTYSAGSLFFLSPRIKTKNYLCSHTRLNDFLDLMIKAIAPVFWCFGPASPAIYTSLLAINLVFSIVRDGILFFFLPYYNIPVLRAAMSINAITTLFAFSTMLPKIISHHLVFNNSSFSSLVFVMFVPLLLNFYLKQLRKTLINILANPAKINSYHLLHYWEICKYFSSQCRPQRPRSKVIDEHYLYFGSAIEISPLIKDLLSPENTIDFWDPKTTELIEKHLFYSSLDLLKASSQKTSDREIVKCCLSRYYSKYESLYVLADYLIDDGVKKSSSISMILSFYLIRIDLFKKVSVMGRNKQDSQEDQDTINQSDMQKYFQLYDIYEYLKTCIAEQVKCQIKFWENFQIPEPDCNLLLKLTKEVHSKAIDVKKGWSYYRTFNENRFTQPFLVYGLYYSYVQNDFVSGDFFLQSYYSAEAKKYHEETTGSKARMGMQILYNSIQLSVSGYSNSLGKIFDCTDNVESLLGHNKLLILGKPINSIVPYLFPDKHDSSANHSTNFTVFENLNKSREVQALDKQGYLVNCRIYVTLKFFYDGTLCYYILLHPRKDKKRVVTVRENGKIVNYSKDFQEDLGFSIEERPNLSVFSICPKLREFAHDYMETQKPSSSEVPTMQKVKTRASQQSSFLTEEPLRKTLSRLDKTRKVSTTVFNDGSQRFNKDEIFFFSFPPQRGQRSSMATKRMHKIVSYHVKLESYAAEGDTVLTISLTKISADQKLMDPMALSTINWIQEQEGYELKRRETISLDHTVIVSPTRSKKGNKEASSAGLRQLIFKKKKFQVVTEGPSESAEDYDDDADGVFLQTDENVAHMQVRSKTKTINGTAFSEENEILNGATTDMNDLMSPTRGPEKVLSRLTTIVPDDRTLKKKGTVDSTEQAQSKQKTALKQNDGDSGSLDREGSFGGHDNAGNQNTLMRIRTIKVLPKKEKIEVSEDNLAKKFMQKDHTKLRQKSKIHKEVHRLLEKRKYKKSTIVFNVVFGVAMVVQLTLLVWLNYNVLNASQDAANSSDVLQATFFRTYWLNLANMEDRLWSAIRARWLGWAIRLQIPVNNVTFMKLNEQNQALKRSVGNLKPELQAIFFEKNIQVLARDASGQFVTMGTDNSFQVVEKILDRGIKNINKGLVLPAVSSNFTLDPDSQFIFDNSYDSFFIISDQLVKTVEADLFGNLASARTNMTVFLVVSMILIALFVAYAFKFVVEVNNDYRYFLKIFLTLSTREAKRTELVLSNFYEMVKERLETKQNNPTSGSLKFLSGLKTAKAANLEPNHKASRRIVSKSSLKQVSRSNWILIVHLSIAVCCVLAFILVYYARARNEITTIENHQRNINAAMENINRGVLVGTQIQALVMDNGTSTIRYQPLYQALQNNLDNLQAVNDLLNNLRDKNGQLSARQQEIFFNLSCSQAFTNNYVLSSAGTIKACNTVSKGTGRLGLANIIPEFSLTIGQFLLDFQASDKTLSTLKQLYSRIPSSLLGLVDICTVFFMLSFDETVSEYLALVDELEKQRTMLAWVAVGISLVLAVVLWVFIIRKLIQKTFETKDILKIVPVKLILKNFLLKKYVESL